MLSIEKPQNSPIEQTTIEQFSSHLPLRCVECWFIFILAICFTWLKSQLDVNLRMNLCALSCPFYLFTHTLSHTWPSDHERIVNKWIFHSNNTPRDNCDNRNYNLFSFSVRFSFVAFNSVGTHTAGRERVHTRILFDLVHAVFAS